MRYGSFREMFMADLAGELEWHLFNDAVDLVPWLQAIESELNAPPIGGAYVDGTVEFLHEWHQDICEALGLEWLWTLEDLMNNDTDESYYAGISEFLAEWHRSITEGMADVAKRQ